MNRTLFSLCFSVFVLCLLSCSKDETNKTPKYIKVTSVTIEEFPPTDPNGAGWDILDGPDLYFVILYN